MNIKKEIRRLPYDIIELIYTNEDTGKTIRQMVYVKPPQEEAALKFYDVRLMRRFTEELTAG